MFTVHKLDGKVYFEIPDQLFGRDMLLGSTVSEINDNSDALVVFQTYQRYNFESKSQLFTPYKIWFSRCFRPIKDTILRANHNRSNGQ